MAAGKGISAVVGENHAVNPRLVAVEAVEFLSGPHLPKTDAVVRVTAARQGQASVRRKSYRDDAALMAVEVPHFIPTFNLLKMDTMVRATGEGRAPVRRKGYHGADAIEVP